LVARPPPSPIDAAAEAFRAGRFDEAAFLLAGADRSSPAHAYLSGLIGLRMGRIDAAVRELREAARRRSGVATVHVALATALRELGDGAGALAACLHAAALQPGHVLAQVERGLALRALGKLRVARQALDLALALSPKLSAAREALAETKLLAGDFAAGAADFFAYQQADRDWMARLAVPPMPARVDDGATVILVADSGYGDTIQFLRYARALSARGCRVVVECQPGLIDVARTASGVAAVLASGSDRPPHDVVLTMHALMHVCGPAPAMTEPYLAAPAERAAGARRAVAVRPAGTRAVGLVWAGDPRGRDDRRRSPGLAAVAPLVGLPGVRIFGLQVGAGRGDLTGWQVPSGFTDLGSDLTDFGDTAAVMAALDLIVTSDTAAAHLAGALGRPVWLMLSFVPSWRWGMDGATTPWYPTMRLFRQPRAGSWSVVVEELRAALLAWASPDVAAR
jgi:hypothetical protein